MTSAIILTTQRTGSTFLVTCLDSHPDVCCLGELLAGSRLFRVPEMFYRYRYLTKAWRFVRSGAWHPTRLMRRYFDEARLGPIQLGMRPVMAFKVMYNHLRPPWILRYLRARTDIHILHLRRQNLLKTFVSGQLLTVRRENRWQPHATAPVEPVRKIISGESAIAYMRRASAEYEMHEQIFRAHPRLALTYETMIDGQGLRAEVSREICHFLGVREYPMHSKLVKVNPERLDQMVENYDEFAATIRRTEFAAMLD